MLWQYKDNDNLNYVHIGSKTGRYESHQRIRYQLEK